jgi:hypothetical protein
LSPGLPARVLASPFLQCVDEERNAPPTAEGGPTGDPRQGSGWLAAAGKRDRAGISAARPLAPCPPPVLCPSRTPSACSSSSLALLPIILTGERAAHADPPAGPARPGGCTP